MGTGDCGASCDTQPLAFYFRHAPRRPYRRPAVSLLRVSGPAAEALPAVPCGACGLRRGRPPAPGRLGRPSRPRCVTCIDHFLWSDTQAADGLVVVANTRAALPLHAFAHLTPYHATPLSNLRERQLYLLDWCGKTHGGKKFGNRKALVKKNKKQKKNLYLYSYFQKSSILFSA